MTSALFPRLLALLAGLLQLPMLGQISAVQISGYNAGPGLDVGLMAKDPLTGAIVMAGETASGTPTVWTLAPSGTLSSSPLTLPAGFSDYDLLGISPNGRWIVGIGTTLDFNGNILAMQPIRWDRTAGLWALAGSPTSACASPTQTLFTAVDDFGRCLGQSPPYYGAVFSWSSGSGWTELPNHPLSPDPNCLRGGSADLSADGTRACGVVWPTNAATRALSWDLTTTPPTGLALPQISSESWASAISPSGRIVAGGMLNAPPSTRARACAWIDGVPFIIPEPTGAITYKMNVWDVTDSGYICGRSRWASPFTPFIWRLGDARAHYPRDYFETELGFTIPTPGQPGSEEVVREVLSMVDDGDDVHFLVWTQTGAIPGGAIRSYLISVPAAARAPAIAATTDLGGSTWIATTNLGVGTELTTVFSLETTQPVGGGPYLGLYAANLNDLLWQVLLPPNTPPFRYLASATTELFGPYALPSGFGMDLIAVEGAWPVYGDASSVTRFSVP